MLFGLHGRSDPSSYFQRHIPSSALPPQSVCRLMPWTHLMGHETCPFVGVCSVHRDSSGHFRKYKVCQRGRWWLAAAQCILFPRIPPHLMQRKQFDSGTGSHCVSQRCFDSRQLAFAWDVREDADCRSLRHIPQLCAQVQMYARDWWRSNPDLAARAKRQSDHRSRRVASLAFVSATLCRIHRLPTVEKGKFCCAPCNFF